MREPGARRSNPALRELVAEASQALMRLDAGRLEELALCCQELNRALIPIREGNRELLAAQAHEAARDMAIFARVLDATRENASVMRRLLELRMGHLEYGAGGRWTGSEDQSARRGDDGNGDD
jgi:hypothetical protein